MNQLVGVERTAPAIREVVLNRPEARNALSIALLEQLCAAFQSLASDGESRVVILRGEGPVFSAGLDLKEAGDDALADHSAAALRRTLGLVRQTPLVVIAAVQGGAYAGGAGLMAVCDIAVVAADAKFGFPEARRGLLPALISQILQPKVRHGDLRDLFLAGEPFDAERALRIGLVQRVVSPAELLDVARGVARSVVAGGPETIRGTKRLLNEMIAGDEEATAAALERLHLSARRSEEAKEGLAAFAEKREPAWMRKEQ